MLRKSAVFLAAAIVAASPARAVDVWDLALDYAEDLNPNGAWQYGQVASGILSFSQLAWNAATSSYGVGAVGQTFLFKNNGLVFDFGVNPGKVSLESDWGHAAVRWTAPAAGDYAFTISVGGSTASGPGGFGNNFAQYAGVSLDGVAMMSNSFTDSNGIKLAQWSFTATLAANATLDTYVLNPGFASGGNTQTEVTISSVPEPGTLLSLAVGLGLVAGISRRRASAPAVA